MIIFTFEYQFEYILDKKYTQNICIGWLPIPMSEI